MPPTHPAGAPAERSAVGLLADIGTWRRRMGESTALWATDVTFHDGWWTAFTGARSADYNVAVCHGGLPGEAVEAAFADVLALQAPAMIMLAGACLADAQFLAEQGWVCVGATPFLGMAPLHGVADPDVRRLAADEYPAARLLLEGAFGLHADLAQLALPDRSVQQAGTDLWGLYQDGRLVSCVGTKMAGPSIVWWSMATDPARKRQGLGRRLTTAVLHDAAAEGLEVQLCLSSPEGLAFYESLGFVELERWQIWSRRRWVIGRS